MVLSAIHLVYLYSSLFILQHGDIRLKRKAEKRFIFQFIYITTKWRFGSHWHYYIYILVYLYYNTNNTAGNKLDNTFIFQFIYITTFKLKKFHQCLQYLYSSLFILQLVERVIYKNIMKIYILVYLYYNQRNY